MGAGKILAIVAGIVTLVGTFVLALFGSTGLVGSGLGLALNIPELFTNADSYATFIGTEIWLYYIVLVLFIIWLASGVLQLIGIKSRVVIIIFSLFPLAVGVMIMMVFYAPDLFGGTSGPFAGLFTLAMVDEQIADLFPFLVNIGDVAIGTYVLIAGGVLGIVSGILPREDYY
ncbi:MAG: hypothetical protein GF317_22225 [Candidatus Lokiarchaeota archaeon]|nr:hypothetical protein [Candidatus Lokiarchaeota archaeon]MBD3202178.1 hypothetical protein [Candidatus Lokiarchaeota archaeon]